MAVDELFLMPTWQASQLGHLPRHPATCCRQQWQLLTIQPSPEGAAHPDGERAFPQGQWPATNKGPERAGLGEQERGGEEQLLTAIGAT